MKFSTNEIEDFVGLIWTIVMFSPLWAAEYFKFTVSQAIGWTLFNMVFMSLVGIFFASIYFVVKERSR